MREREERARGGFLSAPSPTASDPARATVVRADVERAMEYLDATGAGLAKEGDDYRIGLDNAKLQANARTNK